MSILKADNVTKVYKTRVALKDVTLTFESGKIYGLLGPNGSGKTTLMKMFVGLMQPTKGKCTLDGKEIGPKERSSIVYMPTYSYIYDSMTLKKVGEFHADFYPDFDKEKYFRLLDELQLETDLTIRALSSGMYAKLKVALTMSRKSSFILLDEPLNGIDLIGRDTVMKTIINNLSKDSALLVSSHLVEQLEPVLDEVVLLSKGIIHFSGNVEELREKENKSVADKYREVFGL